MQFTQATHPWLMNSTELSSSSSSF